jgi:hypothetical protein
MGGPSGEGWGVMWGGVGRGRMGDDWEGWGGDVGSGDVSPLPHPYLGVKMGREGR